MKKRLSLMRGVLTAIAGCGATGKISLGDDAKALMKANEVTPVTTECGGATKHPNVCCRGEACYAWLDDPFRPCEFGYENVFDGSKCCSIDSPVKCAPVPPPPEPAPPCSPEDPKGCDQPPNPWPCRPEYPCESPTPSDLDICSPQNPAACHPHPGDENASCMTIDGQSVVSVNILNGAVSKLFDFQGDVMMVSSIAFVGGHILFCDGNKEAGGGVKRIGLAGEKHVVEALSNEPCEAVTADESMVWVHSMYTQTLKGYPSMGAVSTQTASVTHSAPFISRLGPGQGELLGAWHSDSKVMRINRQTGLATDVPLQGYDGWIFGVSAARGERIVVSSPVVLGGSGTLHVFDKNGKKLRKVGHAKSGFGFQGLFCEYQGTGKPQP